jgi:hypothetical protein
MHVDDVVERIFLKRARSTSNIWPPCGDGRYDLRDSPRLREDSVLTAVSRIGDRLPVTIHTAAARVHPKGRVFKRNTSSCRGPRM